MHLDVEIPYLALMSQNAKVIDSAGGLFHAFNSSPSNGDQQIGNRLI